MQVETHIDKAGRVVIPKTMRDALGINEATKLDTIFNGEEIILRPIKEATQLVRNGNWWLLKRKSGSPTDMTDYLKEARDERTDKLLGHLDPDRGA